MRAVVIGIVALLAGGCAAGRSLDLVSRDPESPWQAGRRWVRTESSAATVNMAFDRLWDDYLVFDVEIVNHSDSTLRVDPAQFSFTLASSGTDLSRKLKGPFPAVAPEAALSRLDRQIKSQARVGMITEAVAGLVVLTGMAVDAIDIGDPSPAPADQAVYDGSVGGFCLQLPTEMSPRGDLQPQPATSEMATFEPDPTPRVSQRVRDRAAKTMLRTTELAPGASVSGELWMPAWPVRKAAGPEMWPNDQRITAAKSSATTFHDVTLRVPAAVGGQEFDYSVVDAD